MGNEAEGVGAVVDGGLVARAVEPSAGEPVAVQGSHCLNCGAELVGPYCHACGQAGNVYRSLGAFAHDFLHGVLHFEGKIWRTLPLLAWRPGELTRRYVAGERARFLSPIALFLFSVFLMFAIFSWVGGPFGTPRVETRPELNETIDAPAANGAASAIQGDAGPGGGPAWIKHVIARAKENPTLLGYKLQSNAYKFSWALIPISVPFLWLLFAFRSEYRAYDHTVFVTYSLAFMTLLVVVLSIGTMLGMSAGLVGLIFLLVPPVHMYRQLKGAYALSNFSAAWRTLALLLFALFAGLLFFLLVLAIGVG